MCKILIVDDVCISNLKYWKYVEEIRKEVKIDKIIAFVIANFNNVENVSKSKKFDKWFKEIKDYVEIGVHGFCHTYPPEQERDNAEELVEKSLKILRPFLNENFFYRPPGHQRTIHTEKMLTRLGFCGIAYQTRIKYFNGGIIEDGIINSHCCDRFINPVTQWRKWLKM